jgi:hypothetical protein
MKTACSCWLPACILLLSGCGRESTSIQATIDTPEVVPVARSFTVGCKSTEAGLSVHWTLGNPDDPICEAAGMDAVLNCPITGDFELVATLSRTDGTTLTERRSIHVEPQPQYDARLTRAMLGTWRGRAENLILSFTFKPEAKMLFSAKCFGGSGRCTACRHESRPRGMDR